MDTPETGENTGQEPFSGDKPKSKYRLSQEPVSAMGLLLFRVIAEIDIKEIGVEAGQVGGLVSAESNLCNNPNTISWVKKGAYVIGNARVKDNAVVNRAVLSGNTIVSGRASVEIGILSGDTHISGRAQVINSKLNNVVATDDVTFRDAVVLGGEYSGSDTIFTSVNEPSAKGQEDIAGVEDLSDSVPSSVFSEGDSPSESESLEVPAPGEGTLVFDGKFSDAKHGEGDLDLEAFEIDNKTFVERVDAKALPSDFLAPYISSVTDMVTLEPLNPRLSSAPVRFSLVNVFYTYLAGFIKKDPRLSAGLLAHVVAERPTEFHSYVSVQAAAASRLNSPNIGDLEGTGAVVLNADEGATSQTSNQPNIKPEVDDDENSTSQAVRPEAEINEKYRLELYRSIRYGVRLYRVIAERDIERYGIEKGAKGGLVEGKHNLDETGDAWVGRGAIATGQSRVEGNALIIGSTTLSNQVVVRGHAQVTASMLADNVEVSGYAEIEESTLLGDVSVTDLVQISQKQYFGTTFTGNVVLKPDRDGNDDRVNKYKSFLTSERAEGSAGAGENSVSSTRLGGMQHGDDTSASSGSASLKNKDRDRLIEELKQLRDHPRGFVGNCEENNEPLLGEASARSWPDAVAKIAFSDAAGDVSGGGERVQAKGSVPGENTAEMGSLGGAVEMEVPDCPELHPSVDELDFDAN